MMVTKIETFSLLLYSDRSLKVGELCSLLDREIFNKLRYSIGQGIRRKFKSENMSPQSRSHCRNPETYLQRPEVITEIQKHVSTKPRSLQKSRRMSPQSWGHCKNPEGCLHIAEVITGIQKDVSTELRSLQESRKISP